MWYFANYCGPSRLSSSAIFLPVEDFSRAMLCRAFQLIRAKLSITFLLPLLFVSWLPFPTTSSFPRVSLSIGSFCGSSFFPQHSPSLFPASYSPLSSPPAAMPPAQVSSHSGPRLASRATPNLSFFVQTMNGVDIKLLMFFIFFYKQDSRSPKQSIWNS